MPEMPGNPAPAPTKRAELQPVPERLAINRSDQEDSGYHLSPVANESSPPNGSSNKRVSTPSNAGTLVASPTLSDVSSFPGTPGAPGMHPSLTPILAASPVKTAAGGTVLRDGGGVGGVSGSGNSSAGGGRHVLSWMDWEEGDGVMGGVVDGGEVKGENESSSGSGSGSGKLISPVSPGLAPKIVGIERTPSGAEDRLKYD